MKSTFPMFPLMSNLQIFLRSHCLLKNYFDYVQVSTLSSIEHQMGEIRFHCRLVSRLFICCPTINDDSMSGGIGCTSISVDTTVNECD